MNGLIFQVSKTSTSTSKERAVLCVLNLSLSVLVSAVCHFVSVTSAKHKSSLYRS